ncbi:MAG: ankyrin repeat domain-containing protein [Acidocella sp.]|nr:ankyrin repeat domain-containing protein [Acidocella sp.]
MKKMILVAPFLLAGLCVSPALAQMAPGASALTGGGAPKPRDAAPSDIAPPALPGADVTGGIATAPKVKKANSGDPTVDLFAAINKSDYAGAQDAIGRGADLTAHDALGETPLDLSIALNQNNITFLILATSEEGGGNTSGPSVSASSATAAKPAVKPKPHTVQVKEQTAPVAAAKPMAPKAAAPVYGNDSGQPNVSVGYLGFGQK